MILISNATLVETSTSATIFPQWRLVAAIAIIITSTIFLSATISITICSSHRLSSIPYFYIISFCVILLLNTFCNLPTDALISILPANYFNEIPRHCQAFLFVENFCCQVILLHLVSSVGDSFIRLYYPTYYARSASHRLTTLLKLTAPWFVGGCQTLTQTLFCNTKRQDHFQDQIICLSRDPNFVILRTLLGFFAPLFAGMFFLLLTANRIKKCQEALYGKPEICWSCVMVDMTQSIELESLSERSTLLAPENSQFSAKAATFENSIFQCEHSQNPKIINSVISQNHDPPNASSTLEDLKQAEAGESSVFVCPKHGNIFVALSKSLNTISISKSAAPYCISNTPSIKKKRANCPSLLQSSEQIEFERRAIFLNLIICIVSIITWAPYITATGLKVLCIFYDCPFFISPLTLSKFKWTSYASTVLYLVGFISVDCELRGRFASFFVKKCRISHRFS